MADSIIDQLTQSFKRFPGIGPRQAKRFVHHLLRAPQSEVENLLRLVRDLRSTVAQCTHCRRYFPVKSATADHGASPFCGICENNKRDRSLLMLVEKDIDLDNIERSGTYRGYYFVLGGLVPILEKNPEQKISGRELLKLVDGKIKNGELKEIIIALSANLEGDHTTEFLKQLLASSCQLSEIKISTLGRGLSTGAELEYSDPDTLKNALKHRE